MDLIKHLELFNPMALTGSVAVIGCGANGSAVAVGLAKLGVQDIHLYDGDSVESHNLPNQYAYGPSDVGRKKAEALADEIFRSTGARAVPHAEFVEAGHKMPHAYVFCCVDSMAAVDMIYRKTIRMNFTTKLFINARINAYVVSVYAINAFDMKHLKDFEGTLYPDSEVNDSRGSCGVTLSIGAVAQTAAAIMTRQFMLWFKRKLEHNEISLNAEDWEILYRGKYDSSLSLTSIVP